MRRCAPAEPAATSSGQRLGRLRRRAPLGRLDQLPVVVEHQQLAGLDRQARGRASAPPPRRSHASRGASSCRRRVARATRDRCGSRAARPSARPAPRGARRSRPRCLSGSCSLVSMLSTPTTPVGITSGAESSDTVARETSTKSGSCGHVEHELRCRGAYRAPDHARRRATGRPGSSRSRGLQPTTAGRARARTPPHRGLRARRGAPAEHRRTRPPRSPPSAAAATAAAHARSKRGRSIATGSATSDGQWFHPEEIGIPGVLA